MDNKKTLTKSKKDLTNNRNYGILLIDDKNLTRMTAMTKTNFTHAQLETILNMALINGATAAADMITFYTNYNNSNKGNN